MATNYFPCRATKEKLLWSVLKGSFGNPKTGYLLLPMLQCHDSRVVQIELKQSDFLCKTPLVIFTNFVMAVFQSNKTHLSSALSENFPPRYF